MSEPFIGELRCFPYNFAPFSWAMCNGQLLSVQQNTALFSLVGISYGGNGTTTFALPDLRGRVPMHFGSDRQGNNYVLGVSSGAESVGIAISTMPAHIHTVPAATGSATLKRPVSGSVYATSSNGNTFYAAPPATTTLAPTTVSNTDGGSPHSNIQPYLAMTWCIALTGVFPSRN